MLIHIKNNKTCNYSKLDKEHAEILKSHVVDIIISHERHQLILNECAIINKNNTIDYQILKHVDNILYSININENENLFIIKSFDTNNNLYKIILDNQYDCLEHLIIAANEIFQDKEAA